MTFVFAITFFTACFVLDQHRVENNNNGIVFCYKHKKDYKPNECSQRQTSHLVFNYIYNKFILSTTGKVWLLWFIAYQSYINIYIWTTKLYCCDSYYNHKVEINQSKTIIYFILLFKNYFCWLIVCQKYNT